MIHLTTIIESHKRADIRIKDKKRIEVHADLAKEVYADKPHKSEPKFYWQNM